MKQKNTILIVDDDIDILKYMINVLAEREQFEILQSNSVKNAKLVLSKHTPDLIITDWEMPELSGIDFIRYLKSNSLTANIPVVLLTGKRMDSHDLKIAFEEGVTDFLRKPVDEIELIARIRGIMRLQAAQDALIAQKNKELSLHATHLQKNKDELKRLLKELDALKLKIQADSQTAVFFLNKLIRTIGERVSDDNLQDLEFYFNQFYPGFTQRLLEKHPDLLPSELRMCVFLRMSMDSKTIAETLHLTPDSVKTIRKRIRGKMNLERKDNLVQYLTTI